MANKDIYQQDSSIAGSWSMDKAIVQFNGTKENPESANLIATGFQMRYSRQITPFRPINIEGTYLVGGRGTGALTIQALVGPSSTIDKFLKQYGDLCKAKTEAGSMKISPGGIQQCGKDGKPTNQRPLSFSLSGCAINDLSLSIQQIGELSVVTTAISMIFTSLVPNSPNGSDRPGNQAGGVSGLSSGIVV
jgi:hypothetical protein